VGSASLLSISVRLPPFDYCSFDNYLYLRLRSTEFISLTLQDDPSKHLIAFNTDDENVKVILAPVSFLPEGNDLIKGCSELLRKIAIS